VYWGSETQFFFSTKYAPNLIKGLLSDEFPIINAKIGLGRLDFEGFMDSNEYLDDWTIDEIRGQVQE